MQLQEPTPLFEQWYTAEPFPWFATMGMFDENLITEAARSFPTPADTRWHTFTGELEEGKQEGSADITIGAPGGWAVAAIHKALASDRFVRWLRHITGFANLQADPHRTGGGIHQSGPGARLGMHTDFNVHPHDDSLVRAVNLLLFLTDCWEDGKLVLGDPHVAPASVLTPLAGRMVVFEAGDENWHGHPVPMSDTAPLRKSIPAYYYRPIRADETIEAHSTRFLDG